MKNLICFIILICCSLLTNAQTLLSSTGGVMENSQVTVNYSLGENCIQLYNTQSAIVAQGFEQYLSTTSTAVSESENESLLFVYQSTGYINYYHVPVEENYHYQLISMSGQELLNGFLNGEPINATAIYSGTYLILVSSKNQPIGVYKILIF